MKEMQNLYDELSQKRKKGGSTFLKSIVLSPEHNFHLYSNNDFSLSFEGVIHQSGLSVLPHSPDPYIILIEAPPMTPG